MIIQKISMTWLKFAAFLRSSYWFIPLMMAFGAIILALAATALDHWLGKYWLADTTWFLNSQPEGARAVLATIAGSMITVAGVAFSMTLVAVSFALGQIGPRLIRNFMRDRINQVTLGTFIATFLYCLLVLRTVVNIGYSGEGNEFVPHIAILIAMILAISSVTVLIFFIHHIQKCINISEILGKIGVELIVQVSKLSPNEETSSPDNAINCDKAIPEDFNMNSQSIISEKSGYIQSLNINALLKFATEKDCIIEVNCKPGTFVSQTTPLIFINSDIDENEQHTCLSSFSIGHERDQDQDIFFLSDEIAEIIARALSPGVNDPFTAIAAINWLKCAIETFSNIKVCQSCRYDDDNHLRVIAYPITLTDFIDRIFGQIRTYVSSDYNTALHILLVIKEMIKNNKNRILIDVLHLHAQYFYIDSIENLHSKQDKDVLSIHANEISKLRKKES